MQTLSFGDSRLKVVLMQPRSAAFAPPERARKSAAAIQNSFAVRSLEEWEKDLHEHGIVAMFLFCSTRSFSS
jgi:hypothetical protein